MEGLQPLHRRVAGIDVHRMLHVVTVAIEQPDGSVEQLSREFGGFRRDCRALAAWLTICWCWIGAIRPGGCLPCSSKLNLLPRCCRSYARLACLACRRFGVQT